MHKPEGFDVDLRKPAVAKELAMRLAVCGEPYSEELFHTTGARVLAAYSDRSAPPFYYKLEAWRQSLKQTPPAVLMTLAEALAEARLDTPGIVLRGEWRCFSLDAFKAPKQPQVIKAERSPEEEAWAKLEKLEVSAQQFQKIVALRRDLRPSFVIEPQEAKVALVVVLNGRREKYTSLRPVLCLRPWQHRKCAGCLGCWESQPENFSPWRMLLNAWRSRGSISPASKRPNFAGGFTAFRCQPKFRSQTECAAC